MYILISLTTSILDHAEVSSDLSKQAPEPCHAMKYCHEPTPSPYDNDTKWLGLGLLLIDKLHGDKFLAFEL